MVRCCPCLLAAEAICFYARIDIEDRVNSTPGTLLEQIGTLGLGTQDGKKTSAECVNCRNI